MEVRILCYFIDSVRKVAPALGEGIIKFAGYTVAVEKQSVLNSNVNVIMPRPDENTAEAKITAFALRYIKQLADCFSVFYLRL